MAFCKYCGAKMEDGAKFCPACGKNQDEQANGASVEDKLKDLNNTPDTTANYNPADINDNKVMAILAYLGILVLVPLFAAKDSKFARYHTNQGLVLFICEIILGVVSGIPFIGWIVGGLGEIVAVVLAVIGLINAAQGKAKELPIIGKFKILN